MIRPLVFTLPIMYSQQSRAHLPFFFSKILRNVEVLIGALGHVQCVPPPYAVCHLSSRRAPAGRRDPHEGNACLWLLNSLFPETLPREYVLGAGRLWTLLSHLRFPLLLSTSSLGGGRRWWGRTKGGEEVESPSAVTGDRGGDDGQ